EALAGNIAVGTGEGPETSRCGRELDVVAFGEIRGCRGEPHGRNGDGRVRIDRGTGDGHCRAGSSGELEVAVVERRDSRRTRYRYAILVHIFELVVLGIERAAGEGKAVAADSGRVNGRRRGRRTYHGEISAGERYRRRRRDADVHLSWRCGDVGAVEVREVAP